MTNHLPGSQSRAVVSTEQSSTSRQDHQRRRRPSVTRTRPVVHCGHVIPCVVAAWPACQPHCRARLGASKRQSQSTGTSMPRCNINHPKKWRPCAPPSGWDLTAATSWVMIRSAELVRGSSSALRMLDRPSAKGHRHRLDQARDDPRAHCCSPALLHTHYTTYKAATLAVALSLTTLYHQPASPRSRRRTNSHFLPCRHVFSKQWRCLSTSVPRNTYHVSRRPHHRPVSAYYR